MPEFANPFSGLANDRKLTQEELIRAVRYMVAAEYEAVQLYMQLAESTESELARTVLADIADEERVSRRRVSQAAQGAGSRRGEVLPGRI